MHALLHCLSSQNYIAKLGSYRHVSMFFGSLIVNQISAVLTEDGAFALFFRLHPGGFDSSGGGGGLGAAGIN